tara:strand:+ start:204 stop:842 length:639 start_codon:yes stop_codon:yes gene_type:complete
MNDLSTQYKKLLEKEGLLDPIIAFGLDSYPTELVDNFKDSRHGQFGLRDGIKILSSKKNNREIIAHEARHAGIRALMQLYGIQGFNQGISRDGRKVTHAKSDRDKRGNVANRDLEKMMLLLGIKNVPRRGYAFEDLPFYKDRLRQNVGDLEHSIVYGLIDKEIFDKQYDKAQSPAARLGILEKGRDAKPAHDRALTLYNRMIELLHKKRPPK